MGDDRRAACFHPFCRCTFETAAMLLTLVSLGKLMEAIAKGQVRYSDPGISSSVH